MLSSNSPASRGKAGFEVHGTSGSFTALTPDFGLELHAATVEAARERAVRLGIATEQEIDDLVLSLRAKWRGTATA